jgi:aspartyl protease family protein
MLRKLIILAVCAGASASVPALLQKDPHLLESLLQKGEKSEPAPQVSLASAEAEPPQRPLGRKVLVQADGRGHFMAPFRINGVSVDAMIDTGATLVAINASTARRAGISLSAADFKNEVETANGKVKVALVQLDTLQIGKIALDGVQAVVLDDRSLQTTLVGMSFLKRLSKYDVEDGTLALTQ